MHTYVCEDARAHELCSLFISIPRHAMPWYSLTVSHDAVCVCDSSLSVTVSQRCSHYLHFTSLPFLPSTRNTQSTRPIMSIRSMRSITA